ncbi:MAG: hypothetical protein K8F28_03540, partial [Ignavibacteriaceae bacterium]|nr:hypothetical protein [Ignavibacteriaceae bacterium]
HKGFYPASFNCSSGDLGSGGIWDVGASKFTFPTRKENGHKGIREVGGVSGEMGLPSAWFEERGDIIKPLIAGGKLFWNDNLLRLTKKGFSLCDEIVERLL